MTSSQFKRIGQFLKKAYAELETAAVNEGIIPGSVEFEALRDKIRDATLSRAGFTIEEYRQAKEELEKQRNIPKDSGLDSLEGLFFKGRDGKDGSSPDKEEIIREVLSKIPVPKNGKDGISPDKEEIVREVISKLPNKEEILREVVSKIPPPKEGPPGKDGVSHDPNEVRMLALKIQELQVKEPEFIEKLREELSQATEQRLSKAIDILGMPNFRKLAMGLRQDIDYLLSVGVGGGSVEIPSGTVNGVNTDFTVTHTPKYVIIDNLYKMEGFGYTYSGGTITTDTDGAPVVFIRSIY